MKYRHAFILFTLLYVIFFAPVIFSGEIIFPHNNDVEVGNPLAIDAEHISNRKFSDESSVFIPEINHQLQGNHRSWLSTWNPDTQFGRQAQQTGFSKAYLPSHLISFFTHDPFVFYTITILLTVFLSGLFLFLLLKSLSLRPLACLIGSLSMNFGVLYIYWLTFSVFLSAYCWTLGLMWLIARFIQRPSYPTALGLAFCSYSLLMTGYPQAIVMNLYIIIGFTLLLLYKSEGNLKNKTIIAAALAGAALFGVLLTAPVYMDLLETASRSARIKAGNDFFLKSLPNVGSPGNFLLFLNSTVDAFIFGNPIKQNYSFVFDGPSLTPLYFALFMLTFIKGLWRRLWPWQAFILLCFIGTIWPAAYLFAVRYMGFNLSAVILIGGAIIPASILVGYAVDYLLYEDKGGAPLRKAAVLLPILPMALLYLLYGKKLTDFTDTRFIILNLVIFLIFYVLTIVPSRSVKTWGLLVLTLVSVFVYGGNLRLIRPQSSIHTTSPVIEFIRAQTADNSRFAFVGYKQIIPPNQESLLGLRSIHSYDSLSTREYQNLVKKLSSKGTITYGRHFDFITDGSRLGRPEFSYAGIGLYIASYELRHPALRKIAQWRQYRFYKPIKPPILHAQVVDYDLNEGSGAGTAMIQGPLGKHALLPVKRLDAFTDYKTYSLTPAPKPTLLFLSQQYDRRWRARSKAGPLKTLMVNDFYEGVVIPPGTAEVTLEFRPLSLWMWAGQVIFILLGAVLAGRYIISRKRKGRGGTAPKGENDSL